MLKKKTMTKNDVQNSISTKMYLTTIVASKKVSTLFSTSDLMLTEVKDTAECTLLTVNVLRFRTLYSLPFLPKFWFYAVISYKI